MVILLTGLRVGSVGLGGGEADLAHHGGKGRGGSEGGCPSNPDNREGGVGEGGLGGGVQYGRRSGSRYCGGIHGCDYLDKDPRREEGDLGATAGQLLSFFSLSSSGAPPRKEDGSLSRPLFL